MPNPETIRLQNLGVEGFRGIFPSTINTKNIEIEKEWVPFNRLRHPTISSPMIDIAVGPFAIEARCIEEYNALIRNENVRSLLDRTVSAHKQNLRFHSIPEELSEFDNFHNGEFTNENARCFIAVEIEGREDRKVVLADIINTSAMGRFGVIVAKTEQVLKIFIRLLSYLLFLQRVEKPTFRTKNVMIISSEQFETIFLQTSPASTQLIEINTS